MMATVLPFEFGKHTGRHETQAIMGSWLSEPNWVTQIWMRGRGRTRKANPLAATANVGQHMTTF